MLKFTPLALALLTLLSTATTARSAISNSSLQPSANLHAQVLMRGGGQPQQSQPQQQQNQPQQQQSQPQQQQSQPQQRQAEQPRQGGGLFGNSGPEQRSDRGGFFRDRGPERRRPYNFRRPYRPYEGRGQWHRERRYYP
jgi:hypothetical protein